MKMFLMSLTILLTLFTTLEAFAVPPTLIFKNQFGEQTNANVLGGTLVGVAGTAITANTIVANLTGSTALPTAASYSAVSAKLVPSMLLTGFSAGAGTVAGTDTVLQGIDKLAGNTQNLPVISNLLTGFSAGAGTCSASDSIKVCMQKLAGNVAAHQADSTASDVAGLVVDFNALLAKLQAAHLMQ